MKRTFAIGLALALLCGCGQAEQPLTQAELVSPAAPAEPVAVVEDSYGYTIPESWTEVSENDGSWGWLTAETEADAGLERQGDYLTDRTYDEDAREIVFARYDLEGRDPVRLAFPLEEDDGPVSRAYNQYCFTSDSLWLTHDTYTVIDEDSGETEVDSVLERWGLDQALLAEYPLNELLELGTDAFVTGLAPAPTGGVLLTVIGDEGVGAVWQVDEAGSATAFDADGSFYSFVWDRDGRLYLEDGTVYTVDWEKHALGAALFETGRSENVRSGGGPYDFFLISEERLRGVRLETGTVTELLSWADCDLVNSVGGVRYLADNVYLVSVHDFLLKTSQTLTVTRVPADEVPEKTAVRLAVCLPARWAEWGQTWSDQIDEMIVLAMNQFNRGSAEYKIEAETYADDTELQMKLLAGDAPDLLYWNRLGEENSPNMRLLAKRGYLTDLEPLLDDDPELSTADFVPNVLELVKGRTGGLHAMPTTFYYWTAAAPVEYAGGTDTFTELLQTARALPEDMCVWQYEDQATALETFLTGAWTRFIDVEAGTCDFENQEFYDLLTLCRDFFPEETGEDYAPPAKYLFQGVGSFGTMGSFAVQELRGLKDQGMTLVGVPGAGNGSGALILEDEFSICALGKNQEGAWQFLRTLFTYDIQYALGGLFRPVRMDALEAKEEWYMEVNGSATVEERDAALALLLSAENLREHSIPGWDVILEEAAMCFAGDRSPEDTAAVIQSRVSIWLGEQS